MKVSGCNSHTQLGIKTKNKNINDEYLIVNQLNNATINSTSISSYSIYESHSVAITTDGEIFALGSNEGHRIIGSLPKRDFSEFTKFEIKDKNNHIYHPISAFCGYDYTLYLVSPDKNSSERILAYSYSGIESEYPIFLKIGSKRPISLFGGYTNSAAINSDGSIILIPESVRNFPKIELQSSYLPNNEEIVNVACCNYFIYVLNSEGQVYVSDFNADIEDDQNELNFEKVESFENIKIDEIAGTYNHCLAISEEGRVFGCGSNYLGELCKGKEKKYLYDFEEIQSLKKFDIKSAYAGFSHSLFKTKDGKLLACGSNDYGQLMCHEPSKESVRFPQETDTEANVQFCVAGENLSVVFIGNDPAKSPNRKVQIGDFKLKDHSIIEIGYELIRIACSSG